MTAEQLNAQLIFQDRTEKTATQQWADFSPIKTGEDYLESIRERETLLLLPLHTKQKN